MTTSVEREARDAGGSRPVSGETGRSARSGAIGLVGAAASGLFGFVLAVVITRGYGSAGAGAFFAAIGVVTVATAICTLGAETGIMWALPRRRRGPDGDAARVLPVALAPPIIASVAVAVAGVIAADWLAPRLLDSSGSAGRPLIEASFSALPVVVAMTLLLAALRCVRSIEAYVVVQFLLLPIGRPALVGVFVLVGGGVVLGMIGWLVPAVVALVTAALLVGRSLGIGRGVGLRPLRSDWRTFWGFALPRAASAAIDAGSMWVGVLMTAALASQAEAGIFGAVGRYVLAGQLAMQGLRVAVSPQLSRLLGRGQRDEAAQVHRQMTTWSLVLSLPVYLLLAVFGLGFLQLFGPDFTSGAAAMTVLAVAMLVNVAVGNVQSLLLMGGRSGLHLSATVANVLVNLTLGFALIPGHGALGAAVAWGVGIVVENLIAAVAARRVVGHPLFTAGMARTALIAVVAVGAASALAVTIAGQGVEGLAVALGILAVGCVSYLTIPRVRRRLWDILKQIRGGGAGSRASADVALGDTGMKGR
ncbi:lipopolysaccharide biosynthesis protein [Micromonospora sp. NPDC049679]|uniref:lipopolysaccharide biosynthesis protein n=1 Tax=Micromonospora sp. NPDC049679 TaxID=3155920 RepID=UPI0033E06E35